MTAATKKHMVEAAYGRKPERMPIWFMRQAGRYLPEYREVRAGVEFVDLFRRPDLAAEVTLQPMRRYDLDASIIFADILTPCTEMGQDLTIGKGHGPILKPVVRSQDDVNALRVPDGEKDLGYVGESIAKTKAGLRPEQTMIGFAGAPFTVASYMIEGGGSKTYTEIKRLMFCDPRAFSGLLDKIVDTTISYLAMQVKAGADALMLFDSWAGQLAPADYLSMVKPALRRLMDEVKKLEVPLIFFPGQGADRYGELAELPMDVIQVHWSSRLSMAGEVLKSQGLDVTLQGNLDPNTLVAPEEHVRQRTREILQEGQKSARAHIFNVGHGLMPHIPPESLHWVIDEIRKNS